MCMMDTEFDPPLCVYCNHKMKWCKEGAAWYCPTCGSNAYPTEYLSCPFEWVPPSEDWRAQRPMPTTVSQPYAKSEVGDIARRR